MENYQSSKLYRIRHSVAHIMAQAVLEFYPEAKIAIGPPIAEGFYYDFDIAKPFSELDLERIETRMKEIIKENHNFTINELAADQLRKLFENQTYKLELIDDILAKNTDEYGNKLAPGEKPILTTYTHSSFVDLCRGPHVNSTKEIKADAIKLLRVAGAYWRGDETRPMLQRIYGTAFESKQELEEYLNKLEEAKLRDHRNLGKQLDLFSFSDLVGAGLTLWHPKGALVRHLAESFSKEAHLLNGYQTVATPHIGKSILWETSGHLNFYRDGMYAPIEIEGEQYFLKPMNCPFHIQIYKSKMRSYRELPIRFAEFGTVYRYERSGTLSGLTRVRGFTQDDAHIFCTPDQANTEIRNALRFSLYVLRTFGLTDFKAYISTRPPNKSVGSDVDWEYATNALIQTVQDEKLPFEIDEGGGAFYGPKIDLKLLDSIGREWQLSTVQFDFNLPSRFNLEYVGQDGNPHTPYMVHRALFGSVERFFAMLIENYKGDFPIWLAPVQAMLIPISEAQIDFARSLVDQLRRAGLRAEVDDSTDRMQAKIRNSEMQKIPFALILGKKEVEANQVSVRSRGKGDLGLMSIEAFTDLLKIEADQGKAKVIS